MAAALGIPTVLTCFDRVILPITPKQLFESSLRSLKTFGTFLGVDNHCLQRSLQLRLFGSHKERHCLFCSLKRRFYWKRPDCVEQLVCRARGTWSFRKLKAHWRFSTGDAFWVCLGIPETCPTCVQMLTNKIQLTLRIIAEGKRQQYISIYTHIYIYKAYSFLNYYLIDLHRTCATSIVVAGVGKLQVLSPTQLGPSAVLFYSTPNPQFLRRLTACKALP